MRPRSIVVLLTVFFALPAFPQLPASPEQVDKVGEVNSCPIPVKEIFVPTFIAFEPSANQTASSERLALSMLDLNTGISKETSRQQSLGRSFRRFEDPAARCRSPRQTRGL